MLSIVQDINCSFDCDPAIDVKVIFLDTSKILLDTSFANVWHDGILFKMETYGIKGKHLNLAKTLHSRYWRIVLSGETSTSEFVKSGITQESVRGPLMFLIYINGLPDNIQSTCQIFADDVTLFSNVLDKYTSQDEPSSDLQNINYWAFFLHFTGRMSFVHC